MTVVVKVMTVTIYIIILVVGGRINESTSTTIEMLISPGMVEGRRILKCPDCSVRVR